MLDETETFRHTAYRWEALYTHFSCRENFQGYRTQCTLQSRQWRRPVTSYGAKLLTDSGVTSPFVKHMHMQQIYCLLGDLIDRLTGAAQQGALQAVHRSSTTCNLILPTRNSLYFLVIPLVTFLLSRVGSEDGSVSSPDEVLGMFSLA